MKWLSRSEAVSRFGQIKAQLQTVVIAADIPKMRDDIPIPPYLSVQASSPPPSSYQWYAEIGEHCVVIEYPIEVIDQDSDCVVITTPYSLNELEKPDREVLLDLRDLPESIFLTRPVFIQGRKVGAEWAVYRSDPRGWDEPFYAAKSRRDVDGFFEFLRRDPWNDGCFVDKYDIQCEWAIEQEVNSVATVIAAYPRREEALKIAWEFGTRGGWQTALSILDHKRGQRTKPRVQQSGNAATRNPGLRRPNHSYANSVRSLLEECRFATFVNCDDWFLRH